ncbi:MAG TPA: hypothetical protein PLT09_03530 [Deltaproteobacteria bacterium]|nr:hypothetical protein [Deltaproteobacteria bacterium]HPR56282.1 hypothetical protein [Deltaproteobacteria bacterium]HXK46484.1 hypothetical protein [Deltaproteobacteria bacterium]
MSDGCCRGDCRETSDLREACGELTEESVEEFGELIRYTASGFIGGLVLGFILDLAGLSRNGIGQWLVRTISGEGESILEGVFALRKRVSGAIGSMAQAYGTGKLLGMVLPWLIDGVSRLAGMDVYGVQGFYIPYFYALSDQIGGQVSGYVFLRKHSDSPRRALKSYFSHPVMLSGFIVILAVPAGLFVARVLGFSPSTQVLTATETIAANLCWLPPLAGWIAEKKR